MLTYLTPYYMCRHHDLHRNGLPVIVRNLALSVLVSHFAVWRQAGFGKHNDLALMLCFILVSMRRKVMTVRTKHSVWPFTSIHCRGQKWLQLHPTPFSKRTWTSLLCLWRETNRCPSIRLNMPRRTSAPQSKHVDIYHPLTSHHNCVLACSCSQARKGTICQWKLILSPRLSRTEQ